MTEKITPARQQETTWVCDYCAAERKFEYRAQEVIDGWTIVSWRTFGAGSKHRSVHVCPACWPRITPHLEPRR